jgi:hypothetical protein
MREKDNIRASTIKNRRPPKKASKELFQEIFQGLYQRGTPIYIIHQYSMGHESGSANLYMPHVTRCWLLRRLVWSVCVKFCFAVICKCSAPIDSEG